MQFTGEHLEKPAVTVIIAAAGRGTRMVSKKNKVFLELGSIPLLARTIKAFENTGVDLDFVIVVSKSEDKAARQLMEDWCPEVAYTIAIGGKERQESVYNGLLVAKGKPPDVILIHDGARPFVSKEVICACIEAALGRGAACVGVPLKDTIKRVDTGFSVIETLDRSELFQVQTPQAFQFNIILEAHQKAILDGFCGTDDAQLVERTGIKVKMIPGEYSNIKITTQEDIVFAEAILRKRI